MAILLIYLTAASIFSLEGIGEDDCIFKDPFLELKDKAYIEVTLRPEFSILNKDGDFRGLFWTNPFYLKFAVPVTKGFIFGIGNQTRFTQSFDLYFNEDNLNIHLDGKGGIEEIYLNLNNDFGLGEIALRGSYLLGNASEIWNYYIGNFYLVDSFDYKYEGKIFSAGLKLRAKGLFDISAFYEGFGDVTMEGEDSDSTIDLPDRVSLSIVPKAKVLGGFLAITVERSFWPDNGQSNVYRSPYRFKLALVKERFSVDYFLNPWYLNDITEHGIDISLSIPIRRVGSLIFDLGCSMKNKESLREFRISPEVKLVLTELFVRRRK
jgi:hypothetical protein